MAPNLSSEKRAKFLKIIRGLKKKFPTAYPIKIRTLRKSDFKGYYGLTELKDGKSPYFLISLLQDNYAVMVDSLLHEYSHALCYSLVQKEQESPHWHNPAWGCAYADVYSWCIEFNGPDEIASKCKLV